MLARTLKFAIIGTCALGMSLICLPTLAATPVQTGFWSIVGEEGPGSGLNISVQDNRLGLTIFTYDESGEAIWYLAVADLNQSNSQLVARLFTARDGQPLDSAFSPAEMIDTGRDVRITFTGTTTGELTLGDTTKRIQLLRFAGPNITIPGDPDPQYIDTIPDISGEWLFVVRLAGQSAQTRVLHFAPLSTLPPVGGEIPDAPVLFVHEDNPLSRAFFYCDVENFGGLNLRVPTCYLRLVENERITEYNVPTENISPQRFDAAIVSIPEEPLPEVFAIRLGD